MQPLDALPLRLPSEGSDNSFPRHRRLLAGSDYKLVFDQAKRMGNAHWTVYGWKHGEDRTRLGLAIAKRYVRRAHERNRLKRIAREAFRHMQNKLIGVDIVVMSGKMALTSDNAILNQQLVKLLTLYTQHSNTRNRIKS